MNCRRCPHLEYHGGIGGFFTCALTGAQVCEEDFDEEFPCAANLPLRGDHSAFRSKELCLSIIRVVAARGLLTELLAHYTAAEQLRLETLFAEDEAEN